MQENKDLTPSAENGKNGESNVLLTSGGKTSDFSKLLVRDEISDGFFLCSTDHENYWISCGNWIIAKGTEKECLRMWNERDPIIILGLCEIVCSFHLQDLKSQVEFLTNELNKIKNA